MFSDSLTFVCNFAASPVSHLMSRYDMQPVVPISGMLFTILLYHMSLRWLPARGKVNFIMKGLFKTLILSAVVFMTASCTSVKQTAPVMAIGGNNITTNVEADLDYNGIKKIQGTATTTRVLWIFSHTPNGNKKLKANNRYKGMSNTEAAALYRAKTTADVDVVLEPEFEVETKSYFFGIFKKTKVKATGWGANIKGFKAGNMPNTTEKFSGNGLL